MSFGQHGCSSWSSTQMVWSRSLRHVSVLGVYAAGRYLYDTVLQCKTVWLIIILEVLLGLKSKQGYVTAAFLRADLGEDRKVFFGMPQGFKVKGNNGRPMVLKLLKTLYRLRQSPRAFWKYMAAKMKLCGMVQSKMGPFLFIGKKVMEIIYVDDIIFWSIN